MMINRTNLYLIKSPYKCTCSVIVSEVRFKCRERQEEQGRHRTVLEKVKARFGYKKTFQALDIPRSTVQAILKWKEYQTTANLQRPNKEKCDQRFSQEAHFHSG